MTRFRYNIGTIQRQIRLSDRVKKIQYQLIYRKFMAYVNGEKARIVGEKKKTLE